MRGHASNRSAAVARVRSARALHRSEEAQDAFEYLLVIGGVVVGIIVALLAFDVVVAQVVGHLCPSVDTANPLSAIGNCIT